MNVLVVSALRSGSTYVSERLKDANNIDYNLYEDFNVALTSTQYYNDFCNKWKSNNCIAKIQVPYDWKHGLGNTWLKSNLPHAEVYYLSRPRVEHILDLISASQEITIAEDWEDTPTNIVVSDVAQILKHHNHLNFVDSIISEMKEVNTGYDITLQEIKDKDEKNQPKRMYNYINQIPQYQHLDIQEAVNLVINT